MKAQAREGKTPAQSRKYPAPDALTVVGRKLIKAPSPFGDDVWRLGITAGGTGKKIDPVDFTVVPLKWRRVAKLITYAYINQSPFPGKKAHRPSTAYALNRHLRYFWSFLDESGVDRLAAVTQKNLDSFFLWLQNHPSSYSDSPVQQANSLRAVKALYEYREFLEDAIGFEPWHGKPIARLAGVSSNNENKTPRIPETISEPLLAWAMFYVETASVDILACKTEVESLRRQHTGVFSFKEDRIGLLKWASRRINMGRGLPKLSKFTLTPATDLEQPDLPFIRRLAGLPARSRAGASKRLAAALSSFPLEDGGLETQVSLDPTTMKPWRTPLHELDVPLEVKALRTACLILLFALTGMRTDEVFALRRGCHSMKKSQDGLLDRHVIRGMSFKSRAAEGEAATWITVEPVAKAVKILEALSGTQELCSFQATRHYWNPDGPFHAMSSGVFNRDTKDFIAWVNTEHAAADNQGPIPTEYDGRKFVISTRSFRRTLAWYIANRPFGIVAGMTQYKHLHVATFEGYAGTSKSGFKLEVEAELALARERDIIDRYESFKAGESSAGPGVRKIDSEFANIQRELGDFPGMIVDERRRSRMLRGLARTLYPGLLVDCYFDPAASLCLKTFGGMTDAPIFSLCDPTSCGCAYISNSKLPAWVERQSRLEAILADPLATSNQLTQTRVLTEQSTRVVVRLRSTNGKDIA
ncbi:integrase [Arthrobacter sp. GAS37]|uniref:hypothetical protein n=1 Tax=Arthrobacter sp. GAS37 TaxID=3156261 RepID=UPI003833F99C